MSGFEDFLRAKLGGQSPRQASASTKPAARTLLSRPTGSHKLRRWLVLLAAAVSILALSILVNIALLVMLDQSRVARGELRRELAQYRSAPGLLASRTRSVELVTTYNLVRGIDTEVDRLSTGFERLRDELRALNSKVDELTLASGKPTPINSQPEIGGGP